MSNNLVHLLLYLLIHLTISLTSKSPHCQLEFYTEKFHLANCSNTSISINSTRCRGQCYSEDLLVYDWQSEPGYYRHQQSFHCCFPNASESHTREIHCENQQMKYIHFQLITQCLCKSCDDRCSK